MNTPRLLVPWIAVLFLTGCGAGGAPDSTATSSSAGNTDSQASSRQKETQPPVETPQSQAIAKLAALGASVELGDDRSVTTVVMPKETTDMDLAVLADLPELRTLSLGGAQVTDAGLEQIGDLQQLENLYLYQTEIGDAGLAHLAELKNLQQLSLAWTRITADGLGALADMHELAELDLAWTSVADPGLTHLEGLQNLRAVVIAGSDVTDEGFAKLQEALPDVQMAEEDTVAKAPETPAPLDLASLETDSQSDSPTAIGRAAPEIEAEDVDGVVFRLSDYRGKVVMLDFWGHW